MEKRENFLSLEEEFSYLDEAISDKSLRFPAIKRLDELVLRKKELPQKLRALDILTSALLTDKPLKESPVPYDQRIVDCLGQSLHSQSHRLFYFPTQENKNISVIKGYFEHVDQTIKNVDSHCSNEIKREKLLQFSQCFRDIGNIYSNAPTEVISPRDDFVYNGNSIVVSDRIGNHGHSVLILTEDPKDAVACLHEDKPRILFKEHGGDESAESVVLDLYGTDGKYANFYHALLNCQKRYSKPKA